MITAFILLILNFILYMVFGSIVIGRKPYQNDDVGRFSLTIMAGFFVYYGIFTLFAVPVMYRWRPLSMLSSLWLGAVFVITVLSLILGFKRFLSGVREFAKYISDNKRFLLAVIILIAAEIMIVLYSYQFTLDAAYYVANVTTSVQTNSLNIYDPFTGDWQDHFEMRYFFATYPLQDAVMCYIFGHAALIQTKIIMAAVVIILSNILYYMIGVELFGRDRMPAVFWMMLFAGIINFFFITIYTSSNFLLTRTYEGKSILGNVIIPMMLYIYIQIYKNKKDGNDAIRWWCIQLIVSFGSTVISNTSNMLVPATIGILYTPLLISDIKDKKYRQAGVLLAGMVLSMLPGLILMLTYVAYVKGKFVFYTYPR